MTNDSTQNIRHAKQDKEEAQQHLDKFSHVLHQVERNTHTRDQDHEALVQGESLINCVSVAVTGVVVFLFVAVFYALLSRGDSRHHRVHPM